MTPITYAIELDIDRDNTFTSDIRNITPYVIGQINAQAGMADSYDNVSQPARMTFTVSNRGGEFDRDGYLSSELIANGGFDNWTADDPDGWTVNFESNPTEVISQVGSTKLFGEGGTGSCNLYNAGSGSSEIAMYQDVFIIGRTYRLFISVTETANNIDGAYKRSAINYAGVSVKSGNFQAIANNLIIPDMYRFVFRATDPRLNIASLLQFDENILAYVPIATNVTIDEVSVREVPMYAMVTPGMLVRLTATRNGTTQVLWLGRITKMTPTFGDNQEPRMSITAEDVMLDLLDAEYQVPLMTSSPTADLALAQMFDDSTVVQWPYAHNFWMLGVANASEVGVSTYLYENTLTDTSSLETGQTVFSYLGDRAQGLEDREDGVSAQGYIRDLTNAEFGRFFYNSRTGQFHLHNRSHDTLNDSSNVTQTFTADDLDGVDPLYADDLKNQVSIKFTERTVGSASSVIWSATNVPFILKGNTSKTITARYFDATDNTIKISAADYLTPVAGTDYTANTNQNGSGTDMTTAVSLGVEFGASTAKLIISNSGITDIYVTLLRLRGTPLTAKDQDVDHTDWNSVRDYELCPSPPQDVRLLDDPDLALNAAQWQVARFSTPFQRLRSIHINSLRNATAATALISRAIGDRITVHIDSANHDADYFIVGQQYTITVGGDMPANVTFILAPASRQRFWVLGVTGQSELGSTTILGF